ncbi:hypothetical protein D3C71_2208320 [compost metagenome]
MAYRRWATPQCLPALAWLMISSNLALSGAALMQVWTKVNSGRLFMLSRVQA